MKTARFLGSIGVVTAAALTLVACGKSGNNTADESKTASKFKDTVPVKTAKDGGTVKVAIETDTPFTGIFENGLSTDNYDSQVMQFGNESLFDVTDSYKITSNGPATFKLDKNAKTITITIKKGVKWSDGKQVVAKDLEYP